MFNNVPVPASRIIDIAYSYANKASGKRPLYYTTFADGLEIEAKIPINTGQDVIDTMNNLEAFGLTGFEHRSEFHRIFKLKNGAHIGRISVKGLNEEWLKIKSKNTPVHTPKHGFPLVSRRGMKLKPMDYYYRSKYDLTKELPLMAAFDKECLNFFYSYKNCIFSLSFSLAWDGNNFLRQEMEFEYEGHTSYRTPPNLNEVKAMMENIIVRIVPNPFVQEMNRETKYELLCRQRNGSR